MIRDISSYHPNLLLKKHITLKNKFLSNLLISKKVDNVVVDKENTNKILYSGIIFYIFWLVLLGLSFVLLKLVPIQSLNNDTYINSINMRTVLSLIYIFGMIIVAFFLINRCQVKENKYHKLLSICISSMMVCGIIVNVLIAFGAY